ncbi:hypothetical protein T439DRAFT_135826 [Meredithblackwellia eburnea MCA 4105]
MKAKAFHNHKIEDRTPLSPRERKRRWLIDHRPLLSVATKSQKGESNQSTSYSFFLQQYHLLKTSVFIDPQIMGPSFLASDFSKPTVASPKIPPPTKVSLASKINHVWSTYIHNGIGQRSVTFNDRGTALRRDQWFAKDRKRRKEAFKAKMEILEELQAYEETLVKIEAVRRWTGGRPWYGSSNLVGPAEELMGVSEHQDREGVYYCAESSMLNSPHDKKRALELRLWELRDQLECVEARLEAAMDSRDDVLGKPAFDPFDADHRDWVIQQIKGVQYELRPPPPIPPRPTPPTPPVPRHVVHLQVHPEIQVENRIKSESPISEFAPPLQVQILKTKTIPPLCLPSGNHTCPQPSARCPYRHHTLFTAECFNKPKKDFAKLSRLSAAWKKASEPNYEVI